jgi:hypothetical protein
MTDERDLTPEEEAELSGLLAELGGPVTTPPEVVARLDDVLAGLVADRAGAAATTAADTGSDIGSVSGPVSGPVSLDAERRRRRWPTALLAAAAVVAGGYGVGAALTGTTMSGDAESAVSADDAAGGSSDAGSDAGQESQESEESDGRALQSRPERDGADLAEAPANASALRQGAPRLRSDRLAEDVVRLLEDRGEELTGDAATAPRRALLGAAAACLPTRLDADDTWFLVRYDGRRAALVTEPPARGTVDATVVGCDGERLDSVTVPAP